MSDIEMQYCNEDFFKGRIKIIKFDTWISDNSWYKYAKEFNAKNSDSINLFGDRSPCRDPFFNNEKAYISGLCRAASVGDVGDFLIYYTNPCTDFVEENSIDPNSIILIAGIKVTKKYESHFEFHKNNKEQYLYPNILKIDKNLNKKDIILGYIKDDDASSLNSYINPYSKEKSISYYKDRWVIPDETSIITDAYHWQLSFYVKRFFKKNLKVIEGDIVKFKENKNWVEFKKDKFLFSSNDLQKDESMFNLLSSAVNGRIISHDGKMLTQGTININFEIDTTSLVESILAQFKNYISAPLL